MIDTKELIRWASTLKPESHVAIDEGGLTLEEIDHATGERTGAYLEIGGWNNECNDVTADVRCPECMRSFGPHYRGPCEH